MFCRFYFLKHHSKYRNIQIHLMFDFNHDWTPHISSVYLFHQMMQGSVAYLVNQYYPPPPPRSPASTIFHQISDKYIVIFIPIIYVLFLPTNDFIHVYNIQFTFLSGRKLYKYLINLHLQVWFS